MTIMTRKEVLARGVARGIGIGGDRIPLITIGRGDPGMSRGLIMVRVREIRTAGDAIVGVGGKTGIGDHISDAA